MEAHNGAAPIRGQATKKALFAVQTNDRGYALAELTRSTDEDPHYDVRFVKVDPSGEAIPEFPSWIILPLLLTVILVIIVGKQRLPKTPEN